MSVEGKFWGISGVIWVCQVLVWEEGSWRSAVGFGVQVCFGGPDVFGRPDGFWGVACILRSQVCLGGLGVFWSIRCV